MAKRKEPWIKEEGSLGEGFLTTMSFEQQKRALSRAMGQEKKEHPGDYEAAYRATLGKVQGLARSGELLRRYKREIERAQDWFVKEYGADSKRWPAPRAANCGCVTTLKNACLAIPSR